MQPPNRALRRHHAALPQLENKAVDFAQELRIQLLPVTVKAIHYKANELAHHNGLSKQEFQVFKVVSVVLCSKRNFLYR